MQDYTLRDLEEGLDKLAYIIAADDGEKYLPLFECLYKERERMLQENTMLTVALSRAENLQKIATHNNTQNAIH